MNLLNYLILCMNIYLNVTSIDVLPSKNQALCKYCTLILLHSVNTLISLLEFLIKSLEKGLVHI